MAIRLMKSKLRSKWFGIQGHNSTHAYKYAFKHVTYKDSESKVIDSYGVRPITVEAYTKEDLKEFLEYLLHNVMKQPTINEEQLCTFLGQDYKSPEEIMEDKYGKLLTYIPPDDRLTLGTVNTGLMDFQAETESDEIIYAMYNLAKDSLIELQYLRTKKDVTEAEVAELYEHFFDEFTLNYEQLIDLMSSLDELD